MMISGSIVAHSLERMDVQYPHDDESFYLNFENANDNDFRGTVDLRGTVFQGRGAMERILNTEGYGNLSYIIRG